MFCKGRCLSSEVHLLVHRFQNICSWNALWVQKGFVGASPVKSLKCDSKSEFVTKDNVNSNELTYRADSSSKKRNSSVNISVNACISIGVASRSRSVGLPWHCAINNRNIHSSLFPHISILKNTADTTSTSRSTYWVAIWKTQADSTNCFPECTFTLPKSLGGIFSRQLLQQLRKYCFERLGSFSQTLPACSQ